MQFERLCGPLLCGPQFDMISTTRSVMAASHATLSQAASMPLEYVQTSTAILSHVRRGLLGAGGCEIPVLLSRIDALVAPDLICGRCPGSLKNGAKPHQSCDAVACVRRWRRWQT